MTKSKLKEIIREEVLDELKIKKRLKLSNDFNIEVLDDGSAVMRGKRGQVHLSPKNYKILRQSIKQGHMESVSESDFPTTTKKGKTVTVVHKKSGKELVVVDKPHVIKKYKRMGYLVSESINEANFRQGDKFELGKDLDYGDEKLHAGDYEVVKARGPHQYQLKDTHSGKQFTLHKKDFEKYAKKKQFKQINEAGMFTDYYELNPAYLSKFIKSYKKLNSKNVVKKKGDHTYGFRKGEREAHWKFDNDDYKLQYDIAKVKALGLINNFNSAKKDHPWG